MLMLQNFVFNITEHNQKLRNKFKISFKTESQGEVSLQDFRSHFHSCFSQVELYLWTSNLADVQLLEIFNRMFYYMYDSGVMITPGNRIGVLAL